MPYRGLCGAGMWTGLAEVTEPTPADVDTHRRRAPRREGESLRLEPGCRGLEEGQIVG